MIITPCFPNLSLNRTDFEPYPYLTITSRNSAHYCALFLCKYVWLVSCAESSELVENIGRERLFLSDLNLNKRNKTIKICKQLFETKSRVEFIGHS